jgi:hypothetical protein
MILRVKSSSQMICTNRAQSTSVGQPSNPLGTCLRRHVRTNQSQQMQRPPDGGRAYSPTGFPQFGEKSSSAHSLRSIRLNSCTSAHSVSTLINLPRAVLVMLDKLILNLGLSGGLLSFCALVPILVCPPRLWEKSKLADTWARFSQMCFTTYIFILYGMYQDPSGRERALYHHGITRLAVSVIFGFGSYFRSTARQYASRPIWSCSVTRRHMRPSMA